MIDIDKDKDLPLPVEFPLYFQKSKFTYELANEILIGIAGGLSLKEVIREKKLSVSWETVNRWLSYGKNITPETLTDKNKHFYNFRAAYLRAKEAQAEGIYEKIIDIERKVETGVIKPSQANTILKSLRWRLQKMDFGRYGSKKRLELQAEREKEKPKEIERAILTGPRDMGKCLVIN